MSREREGTSAGSWSGTYIPGPAHRPVAANPHEWTEQIKRQLAEAKRRRIDDEAEARVEAATCDSAGATAGGEQ